MKLARKQGAWTIWTKGPWHFAFPLCHSQWEAASEMGWYTVMNCFSKTAPGNHFLPMRQTQRAAFDVTPCPSSDWTWCTRENLKFLQIKANWLNNAIPIRTNKVEKPTPAEPFDQHRADPTGHHWTKVGAGQANSKNLSFIRCGQMPGDYAGHGWKMKACRLLLDWFCFAIHYLAQHPWEPGPEEVSTKGSQKSMPNQTVVA